jgi:hypothetical protein
MRSSAASARACSSERHRPSARYRRATSSTAAHAVAARSTGKVPYQASTPGSSAQRRSDRSDLARSARSRSTSGATRASVRRTVRRTPVTGTPVSLSATSSATLPATSSAASWASSHTTPARWPSRLPDAMAVTSEGITVTCRTASSTRRCAAPSVAPRGSAASAAASSLQ